MSKNQIYLNAPLREVIVEVHWKLRPGKAPEAAIDPVFDEFKSEFEGAIGDKGYTVVEPLTLIVEGVMGLIVRNSPDFTVKADFEINATSINELLVRFENELDLLFNSPNGRGHGSLEAQ